MNSLTASVVIMRSVDTVFTPSVGTPNFLDYSLRTLHDLDKTLIVDLD